MKRKYTNKQILDWLESSRNSPFDRCDDGVWRWRYIEYGEPWESANTLRDSIIQLITKEEKK